jgi:hypothetical protein
MAVMNLGFVSLVPAMLSSSATPWAVGATEWALNKRRNLLFPNLKLFKVQIYSFIDSFLPSISHTCNPTQLICKSESTLWT